MTVKSRLLEILEKQKGETLSGEKLAEETSLYQSSNLEGCEVPAGRRIQDRSRTE